MKYLHGKRRIRLAWEMIAALLVGLLAPMGTVETVRAAAGEVFAGSGTVYGVMAAPSASASGGGIHTPAPTKTPRPTKTPVPVVTPKASAQPLLGDTDATVMLVVGKSGEFDIDRTVYAAYAWSRLTQIQYQSNDSAVLRVSSQGRYQAVSVGETTLTVEGWDAEDDFLFRLTYTVQVTPDMTNVTLAKNNITLYVEKGGYGTEATASIAIQGGDSGIFDEDGNETLSWSVTSSNQNMYLSYHITKGKLVISCSNAGKTTLTVQLYGKEFTVHLKVVAVKMSQVSVLMVRHTAKKLRVKGYAGKVTWKSSRPAVARVSGNGMIHGKKEGTTIISAKVGTIRLGCAVSVTTSKKKKVIQRARHIASTSKYSQARRTQKGYYDCSSLVWRAYAKYGCRFGANYPPTAAGEATYLAARHRLLKGGLNRRNVTKMKIKAGDLYFETGANNGRYRGIYHVEMIAGYTFAGWDSNQKPIVLVRWANRPDGYYGYGGGVIGKM